MTWEGYNYEDAVLLNERMVKEDVFTSIHIAEYETESRDTKPVSYTHLDVYKRQPHRALSADDRLHHVRRWRRVHRQHQRLSLIHISGPSFVSRASVSYSSMWMEV